MRVGPPHEGQNRFSGFLQILRERENVCQVNFLPGVEGGS